MPYSSINKPAVNYFQTYLDYYLGQPDLWFDQSLVMNALASSMGHAMRRRSNRSGTPLWPSVPHRISGIGKTSPLIDG